MNTYSLRIVDIQTLIRPLQHFDSVLFKHSALNLLPCSGSLICCGLNYDSAERRMESHLSLEYSGLPGGSWSTQSLPDDPKLSPLFASRGFVGP